MRGAVGIVVLSLLPMLWAATSPARAAEGAAGFYLLGSKERMAGVLPPPGLYVQDLAYYYAGSTDATLDIAGVEVSGGVEANVFYGLASAIYVLPKPVLGGNFALSLIVPVAWKNVSASVELTGPGDTVLRTDVNNNQVGFGDPVPGATLGWHGGDWHWTVGVLLNVPVGFWAQGNIASLGFNRVGIDSGVAVTWLEPRFGIDVSAAAGITYNFENPDTDYKTGTEFHAEWAVIKNFTHGIGAGISGYHYNQITGDSGPGARLGDFKGRVTAIGPAAHADFALGGVPFSVMFRYLFEFETRNRLSGEAALLTVTFPLFVSPPGAPENGPVSPGSASGMRSFASRPGRPLSCYSGPHWCRY